jgi:tetratricopeptide (TPR) repeat protein
MTEIEFIEEIWRLWSAERIEEALSLTETALQKCQRSADLQCLFGDLSQLSDQGKYKSEHALAAYEKAVALDPEWAEAYAGIGYYWDVYGDDLVRAETAFRKAIELGAEADSYAGLARVLAERGTQTSEILSLLDNCPFAGEPAIKAMRSEIESGLWTPDPQP